MNEDDLDFLEFEADLLVSEINEKIDAELSINPEWWNYALGLKECSKATWEHSQGVLKSFCEFEKIIGESLNDQMIRFENR